MIIILFGGPLGPRQSRGGSSCRERHGPSSTAGATTSTAALAEAQRQGDAVFPGDAAKSRPRLRHGWRVGVNDNTMILRGTHSAGLVELSGRSTSVRGAGIREASARGRGSRYDRKARPLREERLFAVRVAPKKGDQR